MASGLQDYLNLGIHHTVTKQSTKLRTVHVHDVVQNAQVSEKEGSAACLSCCSPLYDRKELRNSVYACVYKSLVTCYYCVRVWADLRFFFSINIDLLNCDYVHHSTLYRAEVHHFIIFISFLAACNLYQAAGRGLLHDTRLHIRLHYTSELAKATVLN